MAGNGKLSRNLHKIVDLAKDPRNPVYIPYHLLRKREYQEINLDEIEPKVSFTVDVEHDFGIPSTLGELTSVEPGMNSILELFEKHLIEGTFFVSNPIVENFPDLVREASRKNEIGVHGYEHELWSGPKWWLKEERILDYREKESLLNEMIDSLERFSGKKPRSFRAPYMCADRETLELLDEKGFDVDSSPPSYYGVPPKPQRHPDLSLIEIPISANPEPEINLLPFPHVRFNWLNTKLVSSLGTEKVMDFIEEIFRYQIHGKVDPHLVMLLHQWEFGNTKAYPKNRFEYTREDNKEVLEKVLQKFERRFNVEYLTMQKLSRFNFK